MARIEETVRTIIDAADWNHRVEAVRRIPERHGKQEQQAVYSAVADKLYRPHLSANFAFVPRREHYELETFSRAYERVAEATDRFRKVDFAELAVLLEEHPETLVVFRTIVGYTPKELAVATREVGKGKGARGVGEARIKSIERGGRVGEGSAKILAGTIDRLVSRQMWGAAPDGLRTKLDKVDTADGWESVRRLAAEGVPYDVFLHQRHMGGAFRQLLDAASEERGEMLEIAVRTLFEEHGVPFLQTGSHDQGEIAERFNLTMSPAPDFVVFEPPNGLRAMLECKLTNDGGTARDKASRFDTLRKEGVRLGGVPVFALLDGLGWERINDALAPVVAHCDGRVFTLDTLPEMLETQPFPRLVGAGG